MTLELNATDIIGSGNVDHHLVVGDNLDATPLAAERFGLWGRVDVCYIDPPYNSGGARGLTYDDSRGGHAEWLSFMRPRLELVHDLLAEDGCVFISIDDRELPYLWLECSDVFGAENFVANFVWVKKRKGSHLSRTVRTVTEYVLCFAKDRSNLDLYGEPVNEGQAQPLLNRPNRSRSLTLPAGIATTLANGTYAPGTYGTGDLALRLDHSLEVVDGHTANEATVTGRLKWGPAKLAAELAAGTVIELRGPSGRSDGWRLSATKTTGGRYKRPLSLLDSRSGIGTNEDAFAELSADLGGRAAAFGYPKPVSLIHYLLRSVCHNRPRATIVDLFAGTATTMIAAAELNDSDGGTRRCLCVTIDEADIVESVTWPRIASHFTDPVPPEPRRHNPAQVTRWEAAVIST